MTNRFELLILAFIFIVAGAVLYNIPQTPEYVALATVLVGIFFLAAWAILFVLDRSKHR